MRIAACLEAQRRLEGAIAVAQQHRDIVGIMVGHCQVEPPIAIEVAPGHGPSTVAHAEGPHRLEGAINVAQQHRNSVVTSVEDSGLDRQVPPPYTTEVAHGNGASSDASIEVESALDG